MSETGFCSNVRRRADRSNEVYSRKKAIDVVQEMNQELSRKAALKAFTRHMFGKHDDVLM